MAETKSETRTRGYVKTQQHVYTDGGWSPSTTCTWGWWSSGRGLLSTFATPFNQEIIEAPHPKKVKMPFVKPFDGTTDPDDHVDVYKAQMYVRDVDETMYCQYFPATLRGITQKWFNDLSSESITSFLQLAKLFSTHFVAGKRERKTSIHIAKVRQEKEEDLKEYVMRFNREAILIPDLQDGVAYVAFLNGLLLRRFKFFLVQSKVTTLANALRRAQDFIQAIKICVVVWQDAWKKGVEDND